MVTEENIENKIYEIRGVRVMLDYDLAEMYQVETKRLNEAVKRNIDRFPADFMFQLTYEELRNLKSQFATSSWGGSRKLPYAFTEQGLAMLSGILRSKIAINVNIRIMRTFVVMRQALQNPQKRTLSERMKQLEETLEDIVADQNDINEDTRMQIELINEAIAELQARNKPLPKQRKIGYLAIKEAYEKEQNRKKGGNDC